MSPRRPLFAAAAAAVLYLLLAASVQDKYFQLLLTLVPIWATVAVAWNIFSGYSGLLSFGHAAFFGIGAYTVVLLQAKLGISPWIGIGAASLAGAVAGVVIGLPTFRLRGHYFALAMLAYPLAMLYIFEWLGLQEVSVPMRRDAPILFMQFDDQRIYVGVGLVLLLAATTINIMAVRSRLGLSLLAIKQNEPAAQALGLDARAWKLRGFALSAAVTAAAGGLYAIVLLIVTPTAVFGVLVSAQALIMALFGGVGTIAGPIVGAAILVPLGEILQAELGSRLPGIQGVVFGAAIMLVVLFAPEGILPRLLRWRRSRGVEDQRGSIKPSDLRFVRSPRDGAVRGRTLLAVSNLSVTYGGLRALAEVSFDAREGEILGIIGPNGAGKTTLFNTLNGFVTPAAGSILFDGRELVGSAPFTIARSGVGRTFQVMRPFARLSVLDNVTVGAFAREGVNDAAIDRARQSLLRVGLDQHAARLSGQLTTVELRLMEIARALAGEPRLLLLDETLAGLGVPEVEQVLEVIESIRAAGVTIVVIEHTMHAMVRLADRLLVLDHGVVIADDEPQAITSNRKVIEAYLGKRWLEHAAA